MNAKYVKRSINFDLDLYKEIFKFVNRNNKCKNFNEAINFIIREYFTSDAKSKKINFDDDNNNLVKEINKLNRTINMNFELTKNLYSDMLFDPEKKTDPNNNPFIQEFMNYHSGRITKLDD